MLSRGKLNSTVENMLDRRDKNRRSRGKDRRKTDRRQPSHVNTNPGDRNVWLHESGSELLRQAGDLGLKIDGEDPEENASNPYDANKVARRRIFPEK